MGAVRVYRVENEDHEGPYSQGWNRAEELGLYVVPSTQTPMPQNDGIRNGLSHDHRFGFATPERARNWFGPAWDRLQVAGFRLVARNAQADTVLYGYHQVAFVPLDDEAIPVEVP